MLIRFIEFAALFAASVAGAIFYFSPRTNPRWRPALKYAMGHGSTAGPSRLAQRPGKHMRET